MIFISSALLAFAVKGKAIDFTSPRTSSGQASWPYETVSIRTISSPAQGGRKPQEENHQALVVKGERHPTCGLESVSNPGSSRDSNLGRNSERWACYHGVTKPLWSFASLSLANGFHCLTYITVLGESSFWFRFRSIIQFLPLWSTDGSGTKNSLHQVLSVAGPGCLTLAGRKP